MPWHTTQHSECPADKPWAVVTDASGEVMGCHPSEDAAHEQMAALYANEPEAKSMTEPIAAKFDEAADGWYVEGPILPLGGPAEGNDLTGTRFTTDTDFCLDWFPDGGRPGLYDHGFDATLERSVIGREVKSWKAEDGGIWLRGQLDKAHKYATEVRQLAEKGLLYLSSGAVDHLTRVTKGGAIKVWPWVEWSLTTHPANPEAMAYSVKSADAIVHLAVLGIEAPDALTEADEPNVEPVPPDAVKALLDTLTTTLTPQALHDAATASGAKCAGETPPDEPAPLLAVAGKSAETTEPVDLDALRQRFSAEAVKTARELLNP